MTDRLWALPMRSGCSTRCSDRNRAATLMGALLGVLALALTACSGDAVAPGEARVLSGGTLEVAVDDGWAPAEIGETIPEGARVRTGTAESRLELRSGEVWLAPSSMVVITKERVDVIRGDVLLAAAGDLAARWGDLEAQGEGVYRLTPGVAPVVKVYDGSIDLARHGEERTIGGLRQLSLAPSRLPLRPTPLAYDRADPWDRLLLPRAVAFDAEVERLARGIDRQHGTRPREAAFYETFAAVDPETIPLLATTSRIRTGDGRFGPPSDALVTLFVAEAVAARNGGDVGGAAQEVADLRGQGARWGVVALERGISTLELARVVDLAQDRRLAAAPEDDAPLAGSAASPTATPTETRRATATTLSSPAATSTTPGTSTPPPSSDSPAPPPPSSGGDDPDDGEPSEEPLTGPVLPPPPEEEPLPTDAVADEPTGVGEAVGKVVDDVIGSVGGSAEGLLP
jgi:hypothetical protein